MVAEIGQREASYLNVVLRWNGDFHMEGDFVILAAKLGLVGVKDRFSALRLGGLARESTSAWRENSIQGQTLAAPRSANRRHTRASLANMSGHDDSL